MTDRERIRREIERLASGQVELSGRELASRVAALRRLEMMTGPKAEPAAEPVQAKLDYPVDQPSSIRTLIPRGGRSA